MHPRQVTTVRMLAVASSGPIVKPVSRIGVGGDGGGANSNNTGICFEMTVKLRANDNSLAEMFWSWTNA